MNIFNQWIHKCFRVLILIKWMIGARFSKRRCIAFLTYFTLLVLLLLSFVEYKLSVYNNENCTLQSRDIFLLEERFQQNTNNYVQLLFKDTVIDRLLPEQKWTYLAPNIYVYSAFLEPCPLEIITPIQFCVKFIGIGLSNSSFLSPFLSELQCAIKNFSVISKLEEYATLELLPENHDKPFTAIFLFCPLKNVNITHATLYSQKSVNLTWLPVEKHLLPPISNVNIVADDSYLIKFSQGINLCVRPLFNNLTFLKLSEFLAYYSTMGVNHFIFYYVKSFEPLKEFLQFLKYTNVSSDVFLWDIPLSDDLIHEFGQVAFTQDCIARSKNKFGHTIIVDLDEYIVPQIHKDIKSLVSYLDDENPFAGSYVIPMVLFCDEYAIDDSNVSPFRTLNHNMRQKTLWQYWYRSKYIIKSDRIRYSGIHFTWKLGKNFKEVNVPPNIALLNHYKPCCGMTQTFFSHLFEFKVLCDETVIDNTLRKHRKEFMNNSLIKFISSKLSENIL